MTAKSTNSADSFQQGKHQGDSTSVASKAKRQTSLPGAADIEVKQEARSVAEPGKLGNATEGNMILHTREALRVFNGRTAHAKTRLASLPGGRHFAAALKSIWYLSGADNPYADWILIRVYDGLVTLRARVAELTAAREVTIAELRRKGLAFSVLESTGPVIVALGFRSPYGYATAEAIIEFDYYVRLIQTLIQKDRLSDLDGVTEIRALSHSLFALFHKAMRWERLLLREELKPLCRDDFKPDADADAQQRVAAAAALIGKLPRNILLGSEQPRHTRRRVMVPAARQEPVTLSSPISAESVESTEADAAGDATDVSLSEHCPTATTNVSRETSETAILPEQVQ